MAFRPGQSRTGEGVLQRVHGAAALAVLGQHEAPAAMELA